MWFWAIRFVKSSVASFGVSSEFRRTLVAWNNSLALHFIGRSVKSPNEFSLVEFIVSSHKCTRSDHSENGNRNISNINGIIWFLGLYFYFFTSLSATFSTSHKVKDQHSQSQCFCFRLLPLTSLFKHKLSRLDLPDSFPPWAWLRRWLTELSSAKIVSVETWNSIRSNSKNGFSLASMLSGLKSTLFYLVIVLLSFGVADCRRPIFELFSVLFFKTKQNMHEHDEINSKFK